MPEGIIIKGIGGFYYVHTPEGIIECKARGKFRKQDTIPMVGDRVDISIEQHDRSKGSIERIHHRKTSIVRPPVANVDQAVIVVAATSPDPNLLLLDSFIVLATYQKLEVLICINKTDLDKDNQYLKLYDIYDAAGYKVICASALTGIGIYELSGQLKGKVSVFAGASGVGKSSILNALDSRLTLQTGEISPKTQRGRHTTRHVELIKLAEDNYVVDTPGFSMLDIKDIKRDKLAYLFREFVQYLSLCRFRDCMHTSEPGCAVIEAVKDSKIASQRYENYVYFYNQLKDKKEWH